MSHFIRSFIQFIAAYCLCVQFNKHFCFDFTDDQNVEDGVLSLLTKKDFGSFRQSVKQEHVCMQFSGQKSLLHFTVASGDLESVKHVLSLGAEVNSVTAKGYTPLIIAVLQRSVKKILQQSHVTQEGTVLGAPQ